MTDEQERLEQARKENIKSALQSAEMRQGCTDYTPYVDALYSDLFHEQPKGVMRLEQEVFKTHEEIMTLEKQGVIGKSLREPLKPKLISKPITLQTDLARSCYKTWRQFVLEGKPDNFDFTPHIKAINEKYNALDNWWLKKKCADCRFYPHCDIIGSKEPRGCSQWKEAKI
jgi:hypothetical protein